MDRATTHDNILICPVNGGPARPIPGLSNAYGPVIWAADGRSLYIRQRGIPALVLERVDIQTGRKEPVKNIQPTLEKSGITRPGAFQMTEDGKAWVLSYTQTTSDLYLLQGVK